VRADEIREARERAIRAQRTPDLEWARDMIHGLARDVLALADALEAAETRNRELEAGLAAIAAYTEPRTMCHMYVELIDTALRSLLDRSPAAVTAEDAQAPEGTGS
jgi:hypothetical protein